LSTYPPLKNTPLALHCFLLWQWLLRRMGIESLRLVGGVARVWGNHLSRAALLYKTRAALC
jgi:hypothetical protein